MIEGRYEGPRQRYPMSQRVYLPLCFALCSTHLASAQAPVPLVLEGDNIAGVGSVTQIANLAVNNLGEWLVEVDTDNSDTTVDAALVSGTGLTYREGGALALPVGAAIGSFDSVTLNDTGHSGFNFFLDGTSGSSDDSGIYWNASLLVQEGMFSSAPQFSGGTPYIGFFEARINNSNQLLVMASVDDPAITSGVDRAIVLLDTDGAGHLLGETVLYKEGDLAGSGNFPITDFGTSPHNFDFNNAGSAMYLAKLSSGSPDDVAIYIDGTLLAEEGGASPVAGRPWSSLSGAELSLNNAGGWAISGGIDGDSASNLIIEVSGALYVQEGDIPAAIFPWKITSFGSGPVDIADTGDVLWYADWDDGNTDVDTGLFLNDQVIVQEGVTQVNGLVIDTLLGGQDGYAISDNGRFVIFEATLVGGINGAFLIDVGGLGSTYCFGDGSGSVCPCNNTGGTEEGCANSSGAGATVMASGSTSVASDDLVVSAAQLLPSQPALLFSGLNQVGAGSGTFFGDGLRCAGGSVVRLGVQVPDAGGNASWGPGLAALGGWGAGDVRNLQVWYRDPVGGPCGAAFNLSHGLTLNFLQ